MIDKLNCLQFRCRIEEEDKICELNRMTKGIRQMVMEVDVSRFKIK